MFDPGREASIACPSVKDPNLRCHHTKTHGATVEDMLARIASAVQAESRQVETLNNGTGGYTRDRPPSLKSTETSPENELPACVCCATSPTTP